MFPSCDLLQSGAGRIENVDLSDYHVRGYPRPVAFKRAAGSYGYKVGEHFEFRAKNIYEYIKNLRLIKFLARDD